MTYTRCLISMAALAAVNTAAVAVAIDFGTNQAACKSATRQANATGSGYS